jgi:hypothetical protein
VRELANLGEKFAKIKILVCVGIHALINVHEYHCIAIRMRCRLMDACFCILCCSVDSIYAVRVGHVHRARYTQTNNYQQCEITYKI